MRIHRQPAPPSFHDDVDLMTVLHIQRPCEVDGKEEHGYRNLIFLSIYTDGVSHMPVENFVRDGKLGYFVTKTDGATFYFDVYVGGYEALPEEKPKQANKAGGKKEEPAAKEEAKKKAPPKKK